MNLDRHLNQLIFLGIVGAAAVMGVQMAGSFAEQPATQPTPPPHVQAENAIQAGRYLTMVGGCNDCHTPGWMETGGEGIPDDVLLTGSPVGFRGPWGTTYAPNLRIFVRQFTEDDFVKVIRARNTRPPMPWANLHAMSDSDLRALYQYLHSLSPAGKPAPAYVPPGVEPKTPYLVFDPSVAPKAYAAPASQPTTSTKAATKP